METTYALKMETLRSRSIWEQLDVERSQGKQRSLWKQYCSTWILKGVVENWWKELDSLGKENHVQKIKNETIWYGEARQINLTGEQSRMKLKG